MYNSFSLKPVKNQTGHWLPDKGGRVGNRALDTRQREGGWERGHWILDKGKEGAKEGTGY